MSQWFPTVDQTVGDVGGAVDDSVDWVLGGVGDAVTQTGGVVGDTAGGIAGGLFEPFEGFFLKALGLVLAAILAFKVIA